MPSPGPASQHWTACSTKTIGELDGQHGPKIEAAIRFLEDGGRRVVIGHLDDALAALRGEAGTQIVPDDA